MYCVPNHNPIKGDVPYFPKGLRWTPSISGDRTPPVFKFLEAFSNQFLLDGNGETTICSMVSSTIFFHGNGAIQMF